MATVVASETTSWTWSRLLVTMFQLRTSFFFDYSPQPPLGHVAFATSSFGFAKHCSMRDGRVGLSFQHLTDSTCICAFGHFHW